MNLDIGLMIKFSLLTMVIGTLISVLFMYIGNPTFSLSQITFWDTLLVSNFLTGVVLYLVLFKFKLKF